MKSESTLKSSSYEFTPGVEFDETRLDGEHVKVNFDSCRSSIVSENDVRHFSFLGRHQIRK